MKNGVVAVNSRDQVLAAKEQCRRRFPSREEDVCGQVLTRRSLPRNHPSRDSDACGRRQTHSVSFAT
ncbi:unnamed protein product [Brassica oleracea var. botrytis]|uniref:Uncharacterized protein n=3 Tax=Brassica TaxID=3705 RepID=A0A0D3C6M6_BRAOL|nr:unnamed protein product [Brassica napus]CDY27518.1 BnaC04g51590D [Brassica napus]VDD16517.1 unnamed protein product [Brassica oleracea]